MEHVLDSANFNYRPELPANLRMQFEIIEVTNQIGTVMIRNIQCMNFTKTQCQEDKSWIHESSL
ncbi:hypothetical protein BAL199_23192 [alpha proteobacterium BAL199]|nr:hypothetical protein BAL199_23192 [alpha proteobacterium BAL199]